jgi:hypothetical protein
MKYDILLPWVGELVILILLYYEQLNVANIRVWYV